MVVFAGRYEGVGVHLGDLPLADEFRGKGGSGTRKDGHARKHPWQQAQVAECYAKERIRHAYGPAFVRVRWGGRLFHICLAGRALPHPIGGGLKPEELVHRSGWQT